MSLAAPDVLAELEELRALTAQLQAELYAKNLYIEKLKAQLASLKRARFGRSSEKLDHLIEQLELAIADLEESEAQTDIERTAARPSASSPSAGATAKSPLGRKPLPVHLPCETIVHEPDCSCPTCGGSVFSKIGTDEREVLEYVPSHFKRVVHLRPKLSCRACETIVQAPMPSLPIERGRPGPSLLAHVLVSKYCDHLPLHRQSDIYAREGVDLDRSTLSG
jgi:transposase